MRVAPFARAPDQSIGIGAIMSERMIIVFGLNAVGWGLLIAGHVFNIGVLFLVAATPMAGALCILALSSDRWQP